MKLSLTLLTAALTATTALAAAVHNDRPLIKKDMAAAVPSGTASAAALASPSAAVPEQYGTAQVADEAADADEAGDDDGGDQGGDAGAGKDDSASSLDFLSGILGLLGSLLSGFDWSE
ncbi:hypothetical protein BO78DRAFT_391611 [Aspergillus sclerotiicarbonarius CBS 121057]|uniref:Uncharacterized protein n=1 Tax=Aspergillus sclerotiicarbonarius (strain CBS 121057 / IBT 28362) TaxID=1448318 RepID=A0A319DSZ5_ASPSB|nr:hypothetical protein BO78DRAFT_391611 [Aspergillus sclerotiicarbonarius CBS 121057]